MCAHHNLAFTGYATVAYIPNEHNTGYGAGRATPGIYPNMPGTAGAEVAKTNSLFIADAGGGQGHNNIPPYQVLRFIIKY